MSFLALSTSLVVAFPALGSCQLLHGAVAGADKAKKLMADAGFASASP